MARQENVREPMNEVYLRGRISHIYGNERFGSLTVPYSMINAKRVRGENGKTQFEQSVETYFPEAMFNSSTRTKGIIQSFREGDHVLIKGYLGAYSFQSGAGYTERTVIYIDEIEHDGTRMEQMLGINGFGGRYVDAANEIRLEAKINGLTKRRDDIYEIRMETMKDGRTYTVSGMYFRAPQGLDQKIHLGDTVYVIGAMESSRTEYRGKVYFSQTFVIQELVTQNDFVARYNAAAKAQRKEEAPDEEETEETVAGETASPVSNPVDDTASEDVTDEPAVEESAASSDAPDTEKTDIL